MKLNYIISVHFSDGCIEDFDSLQDAKDSIAEYECRDGEEQTPVTVDSVSAKPQIVLCGNSLDEIFDLSLKFEKVTDHFFFG